MTLFDRSKTSKADAAATPPAMVFASGAEAVDYACQFLECPLRERSFLPAVVLDASAELGARQPVETRADGVQVAVLRVASADGGFAVIAATLGPRGPKLAPGDFVAWQAGKYKEDVASTLGAIDKRSGWSGTIIGTLKPELRDGRWLGDRKFFTSRAFPARNAASRWPVVAARTGKRPPGPGCD